ncbi:hypothetical protein RF11_05167 [Thelohanellus kitauei]|uniref:Uncharacterized protein n=1 Tax=Thelohanellus kitauei TaxID=669202 RepID=A0A0C2N3M2_THEKT|nr:hypothetical protein RF11_05167 [Thelohanellus kitauei]
MDEMTELIKKFINGSEITDRSPEESTHKFLKSPTSGHSETLSDLIPCYVSIFAFLERNLLHLRIRHQPAYCFSRRYISTDKKSKHLCRVVSEPFELINEILGGFEKFIPTNR